MHDITCGQIGFRPPSDVQLNWISAAASVAYADRWDILWHGDLYVIDNEGTKALN